MKALVRMWPQLHFGESAGDPCSCECGFCVDGGCKGFLPTSSAKDVFSMGELCDRLLCENILLYKTTGGSVVAAHLNACVTGQCPECEQKQRRFLDCPRHQESRPDAPGNPDKPQEREVKWEAFVQVDDNGKVIRPSQRGEQSSTARRQGTNDGGDEWEPQGARSESTPRKVRFNRILE